MTVMASSGRYSKFPKVDRSIPASDPGVARVTAAPSSAQPAEVEALDKMTVDEVIAWVGDDKSRRTQAIKAEQDGRQRKGVLKALSE